LAVFGKVTGRRRYALLLGFAWSLWSNRKPIKFGKALRSFREPESGKQEAFQVEDDDALPSMKNDSTFLTSVELRLAQFLIHATNQLGTPLKDQIWNMKGNIGKIFSKEIGPANTAFTAIRYHVAFTGYALALVQTQLPAYKGLALNALPKLMDTLLSHEAWGYMENYWGDTLPFSCTENVMWSGHVLHLGALFQVLTGDDRYSRPGGLAARGKNNEVVQTTSLIELADFCARAMDDSQTGGMACEPNLVFPQCQSHVFVAHRILENVLKQPGRYAKQRERWEEYLLSTMKAQIESGSYAIFVRFTLFLCCC